MRGGYSLYTKSTIEKAQIYSCVTFTSWMVSYKKHKRAGKTQQQILLSSYTYVTLYIILDTFDWSLLFRYVYVFSTYKLREEHNRIETLGGGGGAKSNKSLL